MKTSAVLIASGAVCLYADWFLRGCPAWHDWHFGGLVVLGGLLGYWGVARLIVALNDWEKWEVR